MADRIGVMRDGRMVQVGTPVEVYERPNCRFVAEFLGAANILHGIADGDGWIDLPGLGRVVAAASAPGPVLLALRPERLRLETDANEASGANRLHGTMLASVYAGETIAHTVRLADGTDIRIVQSLHNGFGTDPAPGMAVVVSWPAAAGVVLPPDSATPT